MANKIQLRRDTASNWSRINPILADGEPGLDITNNKIKMGDGTSHWNALVYLASPEHTRLVNGLKVLTVETNGNVTLPTGVTFTNPSTGNADIHPASSANLQIKTDDGSTTNTWQFGSNGILTLTNGSTIDDGPNLYVKAADDTDIVFRTRQAGLANRDWVLGSNGTVTVPANTTITTEPGYTGLSFDITDVTLGVNGTTITTSTEHGLYSRSKIKITGISTTVELNDNYYYIETPSSTQLELFEDPNCSIPVDSSAYTPYIAHVGKGVSEVGGASSYTYDSPVSNPTGFAGSITFDNNRYLSISPSSDFWIGTMDDFTIEAYMNFSTADVNTYGYAPLFGTDNNAYGLSVLTGATSVGLFNGRNGGAWIGGSFYIGNNVSANTWHHIAFVRNGGKLRCYVDGVKITAYQGDADNEYTEFPCYDPVLIGRAVGYNCHGTRVSNLRFVKGAAVYTANFTPPTAPLTAITGTKLLIYGNGEFTDYSGSISIPGDGIAIQEISGADLTIALTSPSGTDPGNVNISSAMTTLKVNGRDNQINVSNQNGDWTMNTTGQLDLVLWSQTENTPFTPTFTDFNVIYVMEQDGYSNNGQHSVDLPEPPRAGLELTVVNDTPGNFNVNLWDGPPYTMMPWENIRLISVRDRGGYSYWWISGSFSW